ncbi:MAG: transglycosylase SLT domain-containing protein [Gemmatimonadaceae bacterium]
MSRSLVQQVALAIGALATIVATATTVRPVYADRQPVLNRLLAESWRDTVYERAPWIQDTSNAALETDQFQADRWAFAQDLMATGQVDEARANELATYAVREAYIRRIPPALVLGVMLTENQSLASTARSSVGAVGLMQIHAPAWKRSLSRLFGTNLRDDETNLRYGVFILSHYLRRARDPMGGGEGWRSGLLRYNGCVRGTNTPDCGRYPEIVRSRVEKHARSLCGELGFDQCVKRPLYLTLREDDENAGQELGAGPAITR